MNVWKELNIRKTMDVMKTINNEFMKLLNLKKLKFQQKKIEYVDFM